MKKKWHCITANLLLFSSSSIFALDKIKETKTLKYKYENRFELECSTDGTELLKSFFDFSID